MTPQSHLRKLYLINQDYAYGQGVRKVLRETLAKARPDVQIVGDDLHPLGKVKDFAPYISKVRAVDADSVFTSNWGSDLNLLVKSAEESGLPSSLLTLNASVIGFPTAIGTAGANRLWTVAPWHANAGGPLESYNLRYKARFGEDFSWVPAKSAVEMWAKALIAAKSTDPIKVGRALEGMRHDAGAGEVLMRAEDHQLQQPQFIAVWTKAGRDGVPQDLEGTGYGFKTVARLDQRDSALPTTCKMVRPQ